MPMISANALALKSVKPDPARRVEYSIKGVPGLRLYVEPTGGRKWYFVYKRRGAVSKARLGDAGSVSLEAARKAAAEYRRLLDQGIDPVAAAKAADAAAKRAAFTLADLVERWIAASGDLKGLHERERTLRRDVLPVLGTYPVDATTKRDIIGLIDGIASRGAKVHADHTAVYLSAVFNWGIDEELCANNPAHRIRRRGEKIARERVLSDEEIRAVWLALGRDNVKLSADMRALLKTAMLTGQRRAEVAGMAAVELDLAKAVWTIPGARTKNGRTHSVPLSRKAVEILSAATEPGRSFVFGGRPATMSIHEDAVTKAFCGLAKRLGLKHMSPHDLRRTMATRLGDMGVSGDVISRLLNHTASDVTSRHYNHSKMSSQMRVAQQAWADEIERLASNVSATINVVPLRAT